MNFKRDHMNVCVVIPSYNEAETIGKVIQETKQYIDSVLVVDNGCTDSTAEIARRNGAEVIVYHKKRGYGASQYAGQQAAIKRGFDYILQLDADGQHSPKYIPLLLKAMQEGNYDFVIGSRFLVHNGKNFGIARKSGITFFSKAVSILGHTQITDVTSGFKVYKASSLKKLSKPSDTYPAVEQMLEMAKRKMAIKEVPIEMFPRAAGESHLSSIRFFIYPLRVLLLLVKVALFK